MIKRKFIRKSLLGSISSFDKLSGASNIYFNNSLKDKSNELLFLYIYILNIYIKVVFINANIYKNILEYKNIKYLKPYRLGISYSAKRKLIRIKKKKLRHLNSAKVYYIDLMFNLLDYIDNFSKLFNTDKLVPQFKFIYSIFSERLTSLKEFKARLFTKSELNIISDNYNIDEVSVKKFYKFKLSKLNKNSMIKILLLLKNRLNLTFSKYFKFIYNYFEKKSPLLLSDSLNLMLSHNISFLDLNKILLTNYVYTVINSGISIILKKKIILGARFYIKDNLTNKHNSIYGN